MIAVAPTSGVSCERAPAEMATGVRDALLLIGKPWNRPAARLAAPRATSSWLASTLPPPGGQRLRQHRGVGHRHQSDAQRAAEQQRQVGQSHVGERERRQPLGQGPDDLDPLFGEVEHGHRRDAKPDSDDHPGEPRPQPAQARITTIPASPTASAARFVSPRTRPCTKPHLRQQTGTVHREPEQLGELAHHDRDRDPVQIAKLHRTRQQLGHEPQTGDPCQQDHEPGEDREHARKGDGPGRVPAPSGRMIPAITAASAESGPSTITREGPNTAYTTSGTMVAYSPVIGGARPPARTPSPQGPETPSGPARRQGRWGAIPSDTAGGSESPGPIDQGPHPSARRSPAQRRRALPHRSPAWLSEGTKPTGYPRLENSLDAGPRARSLRRMPVLGRRLRHRDP